ncbi:MAG: hypothetical protein QNM02_00140 [Acidimicrobiia bacterium]|nr:hypothetical protein [Acidimicrobiia bacterium]
MTMTGYPKPAHFLVNRDRPGPTSTDEPDCDLSALKLADDSGCDLSALAVIA